jgi:hypothetical protein
MAASFGSEGRPATGPKDGPNAHDVGAAFDFSVQPFDGVDGMQLGPVLFGEGHVGQHVGFCLVHDGGQLRHSGSDLVGHGAPLRAGGLGGVPQAKAVAMKAETTLRPLFPA